MDPMRSCHQIWWVWKLFYIFGTPPNMRFPVIDRFRPNTLWNTCLIARSYVCVLPFSVSPYLRYLCCLTQETFEQNCAPITSCHRKCLVVQIDPQRYSFTSVHVLLLESFYRIQCAVISANCSQCPWKGVRISSYPSTPSLTNSSLVAGIYGERLSQLRPMRSS